MSEDVEHDGVGPGSAPFERRSLYFTGPQEVSITDSTVKPPQDGVVVQTSRSAISAGTELLLYRDQAPADLPADTTIEAIDGDLSYPVQYGYAAVGSVTYATPEAEDWMGRTVFAFNPHETRFPTTTPQLIPVPEDITETEMAMLPSVETATSLVLDGEPKVGERVVVFGAGVVGLCTVGILSAFPLEELIVVEPISDRRERARTMGADRAIPPDEVSTLELGRDDRGLANADRGSPAGADLVYELSGNPAALDAALDVTGYDSRVIVGSWYGTKRADLDLGSEFHRDRVSIESSQVSTLSPASRGRLTKERRMAIAKDWLRRLAVESLVTHEIPFEEAASAYRLLDTRPEETLQVLLTYE